MKKWLVIALVVIILGAIVGFTLSRDSLDMTKLSSLMAGMARNAQAEDIKIDWKAKTPDYLRVDLADRIKKSGIARSDLSLISHRYYNRFVNLRREAGCSYFHARRCQASFFDESNEIARVSNDGTALSDP